MRTSLLPALLLTSALSAQTLTDGYIELTVSDTLPTKVKDIVYEITPADEAAAGIVYDDNTDYDKVQREAAERLTRVRDKLEKDLRSQGYVMAEAVSYSGDPYTITSYDEAMAGGTMPLRVVVKNEAELKKLTTWLRGRGKLDGHIAEWNFENTGDPAQATLGTLFQQAHGRAEKLAVLGGRKLGKLLLAQDPSQKELTFQDFIRMMDQRDQGNSELERRMRARLCTMTFRFALID